MAVNKSLEAFYTHKFINTPPLPPTGTGDFNVFSLEDINTGAAPSQYARYDFFKIMIIRGNHRCHYADKSIVFDGSTLLFFNPLVPYRFERLDDHSTGFFCLFREAFYTEHLRNGMHDLQMFKSDGRFVYSLSENQDREIAALFEKMLKEVNSDYRFKYDLLRNQVFELMHYAMKMEPSEQLYHHPDTNARITSIFTELLERQFPIESPEQCINMRSAKDFAERLSVHVNHLNRAVRLTTGKTTTTHIADRLVGEAIALLKHTNWNVSEISYCLGFSQPAHFTYFFKKHTNATPTAIRLFEFR